MPKLHTTNYLHHITSARSCSNILDAKPIPKNKNSPQIIENVMATEIDGSN